MRNAFAESLRGIALLLLALIALLAAPSAVPAFASDIVWLDQPDPPQGDDEDEDEDDDDEGGGRPEID